MIRLLSVGDLTWQHGHEHALHAVRLVLDRGLGCEYRIVGAGPHAPALRFARFQLRVERCTELIEPVAGDPTDHLVWADVLVDPAVADVTDGACELALATGLAVITTRVAAQPRAALPGSFVVVGRRDPWALADAIEAVGAHARPTASGGN